MKFIKATLWVASGFTLLGAYILAFPGSPLGSHYELPPDVPPLYAALIGYVLLLFGIVYAWMAMQPTVVRPLLYVGAFGKGGAFLTSLALWASGSVGPSVVLMLSGDGVFALLWFAYLQRNRANDRSNA